MNKKKLQALRVRCTQLVILLAFLPQLSWQAALSFKICSLHYTKVPLRLHILKSTACPFFARLLGRQWLRVYLNYFLIENPCVVRIFLCNKRMMVRQAHQPVFIKLQKKSFHRGRTRCSFLTTLVLPPLPPLAGGSPAAASLRSQ
jgi:hypothetical protein